MLAREVAEFLHSAASAGIHTARLDASRRAPRVYGVRLVVGTDALTQRLTVVR